MNNERQYVGFTRMHDNDRFIYDRLDEIASSKKGEFTISQVRDEIKKLSHSESHNTTHKMLISLMRDCTDENNIVKITREEITKKLSEYEDNLINIAPGIFPNESREDYTLRTNLPDCVVDEVFDRGDNEEF